MSQDPDSYRAASLKLSEVLSDIGLTMPMVLKRRRMTLLMETMLNRTDTLLGGNVSTYIFGSQSEGSTTIGLESDYDRLACNYMWNVIQDWSDWQPDTKNLLMIQDETTSPGYCLLQMLRDDEPLPLPISLLALIRDKDLTVNRGMMLLKNTVWKRVVFPGGFVQNGPAISGRQQGITDVDFVTAFHCKSWPVEARPWLVKQGIGRWPTEEMKRYCETTGCLFVPVSSKNGQNEELEWRISTSKAERCLMFSLNITQIRCYILMKMILKTFINPQCDGVLSSFMCKTVLFHCIQNTHSSNWQQHNLLPCLLCCLMELQNFVRQENCPHFIIPENNLMAGRISPHNKPNILAVLENIIQVEVHALLQIPIDDLGMRLQVKMNMAEAFQYLKSPVQIHTIISTKLIHNTAVSINGHHKYFLWHVMQDGNVTEQERLSDFILTLTSTYTVTDNNSLETSAVKILALPLSSTLGSVIASHDIYTTHRISSESLARFSVGLTSDVASGRLKLASALYCVGDMESAESVLRNTEGKYDLNTVVAVCGCYSPVCGCISPVCGCYSPDKLYVRPGFENRCYAGNEEVIQHIAAFCVKFLRCEINCVPKELQYEMFRSTPEDKLQRHESLDCWMDWAVVDSLSYLYFLQYKTYRALQRVAGQQCALENLARAIDTEPNLRHMETALNLLGQCMEQENRHSDALRCYMRSLNIRARNNAAKVLICRLLNELVNMQQNVLN